MKTIVVYVTFKDKEEAELISSALVEAELVACANIYQPHMSIYRWEEKVERAEEVAAIFKTQKSLFENVKDLVLQLHSYECPCIVAWDIEKGHGPYLQWVTDQTDS